MEAHVVKHFLRYMIFAAKGDAVLTDLVLPALEEEIGPAANIEEWVPGVFFIEVDQDGTFMKEYFVVEISLKTG